MTPETAYGHRRLCVRFELFRREVSARSLAETVQAWLRTLPVSQQNTAKGALKRHLGKTAVDWAELEVAHYHRNEANLTASVLRAPDRAQVRRAAQGPQELALIECLFTLRRSEAAALDWADVDLSMGMTYVRRGKGGKASWTLLTEGAQSALAALFETASDPPDATPVFPTPAGRHYTPGSLGRVVQKLLARAGLWTTGRGSAHRFRRSFATEYLRANPGDLAGLKRLMRHEQIATTIRYVWLQPEDLAPRLARVRL